MAALWHRSDEQMFPLFVPANRPDRVAKARRSGASSVIVDIEDSVTLATQDIERIRDESAYGAELGFKGKLLIHPRQIEPAKASASELKWEKSVFEATCATTVIKTDGEMVDAPIIARAKQLLTRQCGNQRVIA